MPRAARTVIVDCPLHIVQRGVNRGDCFFSEADYATYLRYLAIFATRFSCSVHAYCLMTNHVHLLLTPHTVNACGLLMKNLNQRYVQGLNHRLGRSGPLWEGRCHSSLVTAARYVLACYRYIELNPVRAGMVPGPAQYRWSSHLSNAEGQAAGFLKPHAAFSAFGRAPYKEACTTGMSDTELEEIRSASRSGRPIGSPRKRRGRPSKREEK